MIIFFKNLLLVILISILFNCGPTTDNCGIRNDDDGEDNCWGYHITDYCKCPTYCSKYSRCKNNDDSGGGTGDDDVPTGNITKTTTLKFYFLMHYAFVINVAPQNSSNKDIEASNIIFNKLQGDKNFTFQVRPEWAVSRGVDSFLSEVIFKKDLSNEFPIEERSKGEASNFEFMIDYNVNSIRPNEDPNGDLSGFITGDCMKNEYGETLSKSEKMLALLILQSSPQNHITAFFTSHIQNSKLEYLDGKAYTPNYKDINNKCALWDWYSKGYNAMIIDSLIFNTGNNRSPIPVIAHELVHFLQNFEHPDNYLKEGDCKPWNSQYCYANPKIGEYIVNDHYHPEQKNIYLGQNATVNDLKWFSDNLMYTNTSGVDDGRNFLSYTYPKDYNMEDKQIIRIKQNISNLLEVK